ncbi:MOSC domain-containing protein [Falsiroseomonas sp. HC035]|uniref:MOSC domain-containing protein n=1 Tax=Falsiroseomonas sp. HC035 TaxID=3390999 RepID=UPI003D30FD45
MTETWAGRLLSIHIAGEASAPMQTLAEARLVEGHGIEGDRYASGRGTYSHKPHQDRQCTLIEVETLEALARDHGLALAPEESRRNLTVRGVPLNHLVGREFRVGEVVLFGGRLNVPCQYLDDLLGRPLFKPLMNRSGLNCRIVRGGVIRPGDTILPV